MKTLEQYEKSFQSIIIIIIIIIIITTTIVITIKLYFVDVEIVTVSKTN